MIWEGAGFSFDCARRTLIMGIINVTPDSFADGGRFSSPAQAIEAALQMAEDGADILDIGGESTRPGSEPVSSEEEIRRLLPVIEGIRKHTDTPISVDTYKAETADAACEAGAVILNDISGLTFDPGMAEVAAKHKTGVVVMHIRGTPRDMQTNPEYDNIFSEIILHLKHSMDIALEAGIPRVRIVLDPGIGFGKNLEHNLLLLGNLRRFSIMRRPLLLGVSRKSFIGMLSGATVDDRLPGTIAAVSASILGGAHIVRVHDVAQIKQAVQVVDAITRADEERM